MSITTTENLRDEIDKLFRYYVDGVKIRTNCNLNDSAINGENFFRNFLNLVFEFNLSRERIESPYNETIDLHNLENRICVQVTARNDKAKINKTVSSFVRKKKYDLYNQLHFVIIDRERNFAYDENKLLKFGVKIIFHDYSSIFKVLFQEFDSYIKIKPIYDFVRAECSPISNEEVKKTIIEDNTINHNPVENKSKLHIVDQIYDSLKIFEGFNLIYPRTIARLPIFNNRESYFDSYSHYCLRTSNKEIHELLQMIKVENYIVTITNDSLKPFEAKLKIIFSILNHSLISCICYREKYTEIEHHKINVKPYDPECDCLYCQFHKFKIKPLFSLLKGKAISHSENLGSALGEGYYLCKLGEHIKGWQILNSVAEKSKANSNFAIYFLSQYNIKRIRGFVGSPWWESENQHILPKIDSVDLHNTLCSFSVPFQLRDELIKVKEDYFLHYSREIINDHFESVLSTKILYAKGGNSSGISAITLLWEELHILHAFYSTNHIITDEFHTFRDIITKGVEGILVSFTTVESYKFRFKKFDNLILSLMVFYIEEGKLEKLLTKYSISFIPIHDGEKENFLETMTSFFTFQYTVGNWDYIKFNEDILNQDYFSHFRQSLRHKFNKIMMILSKIELNDDELKPLAQPFVEYLRAALDFNRSNWNFAVIFLRRRIQIFNPDQLTIIIEQTLDEKHHRSGDDVFETICDLAFEKANFILKDQRSFDRLISNVTIPCRKCNRVHSQVQLLAFWSICDKEMKKYIKQKAIDHLEKNFDPDFYQHAAFKNIFTKSNHIEFLNKYIVCIEQACSPFDIKKENGSWKIQSYRGFNFINCLAYMKVDFKRKDIQNISKISDYYNWLINPETVDYSNFDVRWILQFCPSYILQILKTIDSLKKKVKDELTRNYNSELAEFYIQYLNEEHSQNSNKVRKKLVR